MRGGIYRGVPQNRLKLACQRIDLGDAVDLVAEKFDADYRIIGRRRKNLHHISSDPEFVSDKIDIVALILQLDKLFDELVAAFFHSRAQRNYHISVINRVSQAVNTGH